jgi:5-methylcytosine-specific restriction endonuclease McrA
VTLRASDIAENGAWIPFGVRGDLRQVDVVLTTVVGFPLATKPPITPDTAELRRPHRTNGPMESATNARPLHTQLVYSYASRIYDVVEGKNDYEDPDLVRELLDDVQKAARPNKDTLLHDIVRFVSHSDIEYGCRKAPDAMVDEARETLRAARMPVPRWLTEERVVTRHADHRSDLDEIFCEAFDRAVLPAVFYILFSDRTFLIKFQRRVAEVVNTITKRDYGDLVKRDGVLRRQHVPTWLKAAIFYRDHGTCQACGRNLNGLARPVSDLHLDHIIPLTQSRPGSANTVSPTGARPASAGPSVRWKSVDPAGIELPGT